MAQTPIIKMSRLGQSIQGTFISVAFGEPPHAFLETEDGVVAVRCRKSLFHQLKDMPSGIVIKITLTDKRQTDNGTFQNYYTVTTINSTGNVRQDSIWKQPKS
jgi:hypothetical protein